MSEIGFTGTKSQVIGIKCFRVLALNVTEKIISQKL